jgi:hypothetical protein
VRGRHDSFPLQDGAGPHEGELEMSVLRKSNKHKRRAWQLGGFLAICLALELGTYVPPAGASLSVVRGSEGSPYEGRPDDPPHYSYESQPRTRDYSVRLPAHEQLESIARALQAEVLTVFFGGVW